MLRLGGRVWTIATFKTRHAERYERDLHDAFKGRRFKQTRARRVFKALCQLLFCYAVYYGLTEYNLPQGAEEWTYKGIIVAFVTLFHAEIKVGISKSTEDRKDAINNNLRSGYTEWFAIPWPLFFFIPLVTWFRVSPAKATVGTTLMCLIFFGFLKLFI